MFATMNAASQKVVEKIELLIKKKVGKTKLDQLTSFIRQYFANVPSDELLNRSVENLCGSVLAQWALVEKRKPGEMKLRVFNPTLAEDGFESPHSIVIVSQDDMPFLVDTMIMSLQRLGINIHFLIHAGGIRVVRDKNGTLQKVLMPEDPVTKGESAEAPIFIEIDRQHGQDVDNFPKIEAELRSGLEDVRLAVEDFESMKGRVRLMIGALQASPKAAKLDSAELVESIAFLEWINDDHFTFLGAADYDLDGKGKAAQFEINPKTTLGILKAYKRYEEGTFLRGGYPLAQSSDHHPLIITKSSYRATVHRPAQMIIIRTPRFNQAGKLIGEHSIFGLYTSPTYHSDPRSIPIIRRKVEAVMARSGLSPRGHAGKALFNVLENFPRDELFQIDFDELFSIAIGVLQLQERHQVRLFIRKDNYNRYFCCMVYVPRDLYNSDLLVKFENILKHELQGIDVTFTPNFLESVLCRIDFFVRLSPHAMLPEVDIQSVEQKLMIAARDWRDDFRCALNEIYGEQKGTLYFQSYNRAFPAGYRETFLAHSAAVDVRYIDAVSAGITPMGMCFYRVLEEPEDRVRFKLFQKERAIPLTYVLPILESMGLRVIEERPYEVKLNSGLSIWISDFGLQVSDSLVALDEIADTFQEAFFKIWVDETETDGFNNLVVKAGLNWREVLILRAYAKFMLQTRFRFSQNYIEQTLSAYPKISKLVVRLFMTKFDPSLEISVEAREREIIKLQKEAAQLLGGVTNLDQDRIFRRYLEVIGATVRTNFFQKNAEGNWKSYLSFKIHSSSISEMPEPVPVFEIFVYSARMEGVHLRGAKVARGGLRWSDRREDYRTEVLGLMKAQQVKNAVIVPLGAKGGFVPKRLPNEAGRDAVMKEAVECYRMFISGLLDVTDNLDGMTIKPPKDVVRFDEDDPYLVVAADKGTATFSDIANGVAAQYQFWLGDAFASGGSFGYDHKKMAITARGAWEAVKRRFLLIGKDVMAEEITVVGIGDMSGDVFGNGLLYSDKLQLVAAFNHAHIFIDPTPDAKRSYAERKRLFNLPRSTWADYDVEVLSKGGGIYERSAKVIEISAEAQKVFKLKSKRFTPSELIQELLKAKVDLLWNGGIGTYIKATTETHLDVGDRSNDAVRINGADLRCKVVGEGGNLGATQLGRIEYALAGGQIFTDAIDNSAGVDCSDHEVNIKIFLNRILQNGGLTLENRNALLAEMQDEVARLVLRDNYEHARILSSVLASSQDGLAVQIRLLRELEREGHLNRAIEFLPDDKTLKARHAAGLGLTGPECAVLMAYSKTVIKKSLLSSSLPDEPYFFSYFQRAFPKVMAERYGDRMKQHPLYREIVATQVTNDLFRFVGMAFVHRLLDETGATPSMIVRAFIVAKESFGMPKIWDEIEILDGVTPMNLQSQMMHEVERIVRRATRWLLRNRRSGFEIEAAIEEFKPKIEVLMELIPAHLSKEDRKRIKDDVTRYHAAGVPKELAIQISSFQFMSPAFHIVDATTTKKTSLEEMAQVFLRLSERLSFGWFRSELSHAVEAGYWGMLAGAALRDDLDKLERMLALCVLRDTHSDLPIEERIQEWCLGFESMIRRWEVMVLDLKSGKREFVMYLIAMRGLSDLAQAATHGIKHYKNRKVQLGM